MNPSTDSGIATVAMLSTHGYVDPVPQLGRTDTGGQVVYVLQLAKALAALGIKVDLFTRWFDHARSLIDPLPDCPDVRVVRIPAGPREFIAKEQIYDVLPELARNMVEFINENDLRYDLYHGHYVDAGIVALDVARAFDAPAYFTAHSIGAWKREQMGGDLEEMELRFNFRLRVAEELRIFRSVVGQSVTTEVQREKIRELYGFTAENMVVIPPGTDVHRFRPVGPDKNRETTDLPDPYIFCLSRIDSNKGHDFLLYAFDIVRKAIPDIHLVIGGGSPTPQQRELEVRAMMEEIVRDRDMQECVHIIGYVPDAVLVPYYQNARLFALPSLFEPFGMTTTEAMASGTPVVASKLGGIRTVIDSGENGLLVDPSSTEEFAGAMIKLLQDNDDAERMRNAGRQTIVQYYSWEAIAQRFLDFYRRFLPD